MTLVVAYHAVNLMSNTVSDSKSKHILTKPKMLSGVALKRVFRV